MTPEQQKAIAIASARKRLQEQQKQSSSPVESGMILPISKNAQGDVSFDSDAGLLGVIKRAVTLPRDVMTGEIPLNNEAGRPTDEVIGRSLEAASVMSPVNPAVRAGGGVVPGTKPITRQTKPRVPTGEELLKAGSNAFDDMRATGAEYPSSAVKRVADELMVRLNSDGFDESTAPKTIRTLQKLANPPEDSVATITNLHSARKTFGKIPNTPDGGPDYAAARSAIGGLDDFISGAGQAAPVDNTSAGARKAAASLLTEGNANYAAGKRSDLASGIERASDLRAAAANSGQNTGNTIRQRITTALLQPRKVTGYNADEIAALEGVVQGSKGANATRYVGNLLGGGGGMGQMLTGAMAGIGGAAATNSPYGAAAAILPMAVGAGSKQISNFLTRKALRSADEMIRMRSPLYESMAANAPRVAVNPEQRAAIVRALLMQQAQMGQQ